VAQAERLASLTCSDLRKSYGDVNVLAGVTFSLAPGDTLAVIGRSGCGKSTLLRCLCCIERGDVGTLTLDGVTYFRDQSMLRPPAAIRSRVGLVFQHFNLFPYMTARRNITLALEKVRGVPPDQADQITSEIADSLEIRAVLNQYPDSLSGGQAQRVALARALVLRPTVLLLDEITSALDSSSVASVVRAIRNIRQLDGGRELTIIIVTHLLNFAEEFADKIAVLAEGKFIEEFAAVTLRDSDRHPSTRALLTASNGFLYA
jgi:polar amino acid transport system ATP-binding protein